MSDIVLGFCINNDSSQATTPVVKKKKKTKFSNGKLQHLASKGYLKEKQNKPRKSKNSIQNQTVQHNGAPTNVSAFSRNRSFSHSASSAASSNYSSPSSSHLLPSITVTVNGKERHVTPKEPFGKKPLLNPKPLLPGSCKPSTSSIGNPTKYLAIDCEMVGSGPKGRINQLARCSIVSYEGDVVFDNFIKPTMPVTDYRTRWSGIRPRDLHTAMPYEAARKEILRLLMGKVVIGHAIHNDFRALGYSHPAMLTRDTSKIPLLNQKAGLAPHEVASLKKLTKAILNRDIQTGRNGHSSVEDAKATMELYKVVEHQWENALLTKLTS